MKLSVFLLFFLLAQHAVYAGDLDHSTTLYDLGLKGNVHSVRETSSKAIVKNDSIIAGKRKRWHKEDLDFYIVLNNQGYKIEKSLYNDKDALISRLTYEYDDRHNVTKEQKYNPDGTLTEKNEFNYKYDDSGKKTEKAWKNGRKVKFAYDDFGRIKDETYYLADGSFERRESFMYDINGNVLEDISYKSDESIGLKIIYRHNDKGLKVEETWFDLGSKFIIKYLYNYDEFGNVIKLQWLDKNNKVYRTYKHTYNYDAQGNWITDIVYQNDKPLYVYVREIKYF